MNTKASFRSLFSRVVVILSGCAFLSSTPGFAYAQSNTAKSTSQTRNKITVQTSKPIGLKDKSAGSGSKTSSMSLNPALFQRKAPDELMLGS